MVAGSRPNNIQSDKVFAINPNLLIPISLQPVGANLRYFKLRLYNLVQNL